MVFADVTKQFSVSALIFVRVGVDDTILTMSFPLIFIH